MKLASARNRIFIFGVALLLTSTFLCAQQSTGSLTGIIEDSQGAIIPGAMITLINEQQGSVARTAITNEDGSFVFTPLQPATYTLVVDMPGFKKYQRQGITLYAQDRIGLPPIRLEIGAVVDTVTVEASPVTLQTVSAERSGVLTGNQIVDLASSTRVFTDLLKTIPGFNSDTNNANGLRTDQNALAVDGVSSMDTGNNGTGLLRLNPDLISEFKVLTDGQQAEFGRAAGSNITIVTKSGTNEFHGSAYLFLRNEWMNANSWINNYNGLARARNRNRTEGFTLGGPVYIPGKFNTRKDKLFFFTNFEFQRPRPFDNLVSLTVPTADERRGDFSKTQENGRPVIIKDPLTGQPFPGNVIPPSRWNKYGQELLNFYPVPNLLGANNTYNYQYQFEPTDNINDRTFRVDYNISDKWRFYARLIQNSRDRFQSGGLNTNNQIGVSPFHAQTGAITGSGNLTTIITPTLTNEFTYGNTRNWLPNDVPENSRYRKANAGITLPLLFPSADSLGLIPNMTWDVPNPPNIFLAGLPYDNENPSVNWTDNIAKVFPRHTIKAGFFIDISKKRQTATEVNNGRLDFSRDSSNPGDAGWSFANALLGNYKTFDQANQYLKGYYHYRTYEWYVQDNWKVRRNLTLDYGIRFSLLQPWFDDKDQISSIRLDKFDPSQQVVLYQPTLVNNVRLALNPLTNQTAAAALIGAIVPGKGNQYNGIVQPRKDGVPRGLVDGNGVLLGPRFGMAWTPWGADSKTVIRAGGGVFFERIQGNMIFNQIIFPPELLTPRIFYGTLDTIASSSGALFPLTAGGLSPEGKVPTVYNYNLSVQRSLPMGILLDVGYVGTLSRHVLARTPFNEAPFGSAWLPKNQDPTKPVNLNGDNALSVDFLRPYTGYIGTGASVAQSGLGSGGFIASFGGTANYNGLQVSANRRMGKAVSFGVSYTWSKTLGTDTNYDFLGNPLNHRKADYGLLTFDRTQNLVTNFVYDLPSGAIRRSFLDNAVGRAVLSGWEVSGITSMSSGAPLTPTYSVQGVGAATLNRRITGSEGWAPRVVLTCNPNISRGDRTLYAYFDTSCFAPAAMGSTGMDSDIRPLRGPGLNNWDLSVFKKFGLGGERRFLQLRLEMFNAFNHTQWNQINSAAQFDVNGKLINLPSALGGGGGRFGFGALGGPTGSGVRAPRTIQIAAKFNL